MYTYKDAKEGKLPEWDSRIYIHGLEYELCGTNIFFANLGADVNARIFKMLGWEDPNELFESVLGHGNYIKATGDASPYAKTYENARKILIKLWETPRYKAGTYVKLANLKAGIDFRVFCNPDMEKYSGKIAKIKSSSISETKNEKQHKTGHNLLYIIEIDGKEINWRFSEDMFSHEASSFEISLSQSESSMAKLCSSHISLPKSTNGELLDMLVPKEDSVNTHSYTSIKLPKQSKNLKITL